MIPKARAYFCLIVNPDEPMPKHKKQQKFTHCQKSAYASSIFTAAIAMRKKKQPKKQRKRMSLQKVLQWLGLKVLKTKSAQNKECN